MTRLTLQVAVGATVTRFAASQTTYSANAIQATTTCGEYFDRGGFCIESALVQNDRALVCPSSTSGCTRSYCCNDMPAKNTAPYGTTTPDTCTAVEGSGANKKPWYETYTCPSEYMVKRQTAVNCGKISANADSSTEGKMICKLSDCCQLKNNKKTCQTYFTTNVCPSLESREGNGKVCAGAVCLQSDCCYKAARNCNKGFFDLGKSCDPTFYTPTTILTSPCSLHDCSNAECCKEKVGIGKCSKWWSAPNYCGTVNADLTVRKLASTLCPLAACTESDCCKTGPTCSGFAASGCTGQTVLNQDLTTTCKGTPCTAAECCVTGTQCGALACPVGQIAKTGVSKFRCKTNPCTYAECCEPAPTSKPKISGDCASFKDADCTGKDTKDRKYTTSLGKIQKCAATGCTKATCCAVEEDATCFPGEAEVPVADGSLTTLASIGPNTHLVGLDGPEPVIGMLHLHSEVLTTAMYATSTSV